MMAWRVLLSAALFRMPPSRRTPLNVIGSLIVVAYLLISSSCTPQSSPPPSVVPSSSSSSLVPALCSRIVSLAPSNTELLYSLGAADKIVGVSSACDYPAEAKRKPKAGTFVSVDAEAVAQLKPDCVILVKGQENIAEVLRKQHVQTLILDNSKLAGIASNLRSLGYVSGTVTRANLLASRFESALQRLRQLTATASRPRVFYCVWPTPLVTAGGPSYLNEAISLCGGENIAAQLNTPYPVYNNEALLLAKPDLVFMPHEAASGAADIVKKQPWVSLQCVRSGRIFFGPQEATDGLSRPCLRVISGLHWLASCIHPELREKLDDWLQMANTDLAQ